VDLVDPVDQGIQEILVILGGLEVEKMA